MSKWIEAAIALAVALAAFFLGQSLKQAEWDATELVEASAKAKALDAAAAAIAKIEVRSEQIIQPLRTEIRTNTVYRDCRHSDDGLLRLNAAITGQPIGASKLPRADSAE